MILKKELLPANYFCPQCQIYAQESLRCLQESLEREEASKNALANSMTMRYRTFRERTKRALRRHFAKKLALQLQQMKHAHDILLITISEEVNQYLRAAKDQQIASLIESSENVCNKIHQVLAQVTSHQVLSIAVSSEDFQTLKKIVPHSISENLVSDSSISRGNFVFSLSGQGEVSYDWKQEFHNWLS
jgi:DNA anti-recombination protein RmuC